MREQKILYADIVIDISHSRLDQSFQYRIPERLQEELEPGNVVLVPFWARRPSEKRVMCFGSQIMQPVHRRRSRRS